MVCVNWEFVFDGLSLTMMFMVCFVSGLVHLYSIGYMQTDFNIIRFMSLLSLFTFFMLILVVSNNFIVLFLG
jgi:NADH:ubiquinone oxidoreductase subunit 5 (subunit L)/multisubunit Na+/H+ antiporter MnhA subunit